MSFAVIGVSHKNCPVEIREKVTFTQSKRLESLAYLKGQGIKEIVILSTCNRSEIYIEDNEIKEAIWIDRNYKEEGIKVGSILGEHVIPKLIERGLM